MRVTTTCLKLGAPWSSESLSALDSDQTLLLLFGASNLLDTPDRMAEVLKACPRSHVMGCSTSGEIHGNEISDNSLVVAAVQFEQTPFAQPKQPSHPLRVPTPRDAPSLSSSNNPRCEASWFCPMA